MAMVLTHEEYLALSGDAKRYREQRDQLREAVVDMLEEMQVWEDEQGEHPAATKARAALKATEDTP